MKISDVMLTNVNVDCTKTSSVDETKSNMENSHTLDSSVDLGIIMADEW